MVVRLILQTIQVHKQGKLGLKSAVYNQERFQIKRGLYGACTVDKYVVKRQKILSSQLILSLALVAHEKSSMNPQIHENFNFFRLRDALGEVGFQLNSVRIFFKSF